MPEQTKRTLVLGKTPDPNNLKGILALKNETGKDLITFFKGTGQEKHLLKFVPPITTVANGGTIHVVVMRRQVNVEGNNKFNNVLHSCYFDVEYTPIPTENFNPNLPKMWTKIPRCQIASTQIQGKLDSSTDMLGKPQMVRIKSLEQKPASLFSMENEFLWPNRQYNVQARYLNPIQSGDQTQNITGEFLWPSKPYGGKKTSGSILHDTAQPKSAYQINSSKQFEDSLSVDSLARTASCVNGVAGNETEDMTADTTAVFDDNDVDGNDDGGYYDAMMHQQQQMQQMQQQHQHQMHQQQQAPEYYQGPMMMRHPQQQPQMMMQMQQQQNRQMGGYSNNPSHGSNGRQQSFVGSESQRRGGFLKKRGEAAATTTQASSWVPLLAICATFGAIMMSSSIP